ncbi:MAG TPA: (2Fe-2S)-binding protein [Candidatus Limnocylindria bacterium]|nr:(2Fe-2S)-binding protein [Candidatus Limnocylindria bacterium]
MAAKGRYSRRTFLKGAGATAAGTAAVACGTTGIGPGPVTAQPVAVRVGPAANAPGTQLSRVTVNGTLYEAAVDARWTLAEMLREQLGLTGTKVGCDRGECGSCTVLVDGKPVLSCLTLATEVADKQITTVEGLAVGGKLNPLQEAFWETGAVQCGFCTPGMLMSATALLAAKPKPTEDEVRLALSGNLCRCTGYRKIVEGVLVASGQAPKA